MRRQSVWLLTIALLAACGDNSDTEPDGAPAVDARGPADASSDAAEPDRFDAGFDAPPTPPTPPTNVEQCARTVPRPTAGTCDAVAGAGTAVVIRGNILGEDKIYADGELVYDGDRIVCAGCDCSAAAGYATAKQVDCGGAAVSPGLINAHDHLNYNNKPPMASTVRGGERFNHRHEWRARSSSSLPNHIPQGSQSQTGAASAGMRWNELRQAMAGTTSIAASTRANGMVRNLDGLDTDDVALGLERVTYEVFALGDGGRHLRTGCDWNYALGEWQVAMMPALVTHTSEGINDYAQEEFRCQSSARGQARDFTEKNVGHIHGIGLTASDYYTMARDNAKLVWSPRSNISLYADTAQAPILKRLGGTIALGTDWTYSGSATLPREMACAAYLDDVHYGDAFPDEDIWRMATINGAKATGTDELLGSLTAGKIADIAVFRAAPGVYYRAVIDANTDDTVLVVRDGELLFAETDVAAVLDASCDPIDVCGEERRVCASREFGGTTFAAIATEMAGMTGVNVPYPAVFCDTPANEPTCVPSRTGAYDGPTATDPDGDGIVDGDNCPTVFNPIRPMDHDVQPDTDRDGTGDACDPTPLGSDIDGDGQDNTADVCALVSDDGSDTDTDGKGNACDECPEQSNPDQICASPVVSVATVQSPLPRRTRIQLNALTVIGTDDDGMYLQDRAIASGENAGIYGYVKENPRVSIGDVVTVAGYSMEYFGLTEIENPGILARAAGPAPTPLRLTVAEAADPKYQGVLVTLTDVTKVDSPYMCTPEEGCTQPRLWEINDTIVAHDKAFSGTTAQWTAAIPPANGGAIEVTGIMSYSFHRRRILPRSTADFAPAAPVPVRAQRRSSAR